MKLTIKKASITLPKIAFVIYNMIYVLYMSGIVTRSINLIGVVLFTSVCGLLCIKKRKFKFCEELKLISVSVITFVIISVIKQIYYKDINIAMMSDLLYIILSIASAFFLINSTNKGELSEYILIIFIRMVILFVVQNAGHFNLNSILAISWSDSESSVFESSMAHEFFFMVIMFKYLKKNKLAVLSALLCLLCFKRLSFLLTFVVLFGYRFIPQDRPVNKKLLNITKIAFILSPLLIMALTSDAGQEWFQNTFHVSLNLFTTGRAYYINLVRNNMEYFNGYGSTNYYLSVIYGDTYVTSIHCDLLRLTWECSIISVIVYINSLFQMVRRNYTLYIIMCYCVLEMVISHFMHGYTLWMTVYLFIYIVNSDCVDRQRRRA